MSKTYELTPPFDGAVHLPVRVGWYACKRKDDTEDSMGQWRRYWNGKWFSSPVRVGKNTDSESHGCKERRSIFDNHELTWCGLTSPHK